MDTIIDEVYILYDFEDNITGYTFKLSTNDVYSGYITVSANQDEMPIQEFSFSDVPLFEENFSEETLEKTDRKKFKEKGKKDNNTKKVRKIRLFLMDHWNIILMSQIHTMSRMKKWLHQTW